MSAISASTRHAVRLIAFDTATEWCTAALWAEGRVSLREAHAGQRHSDLLLPMISELLAEAGWTLHDLDGLAFGMGPGSFTGLRIAASVAQGLSLATDLPVLGISTLEALAEASGETQVFACLDARMGEVYAAGYRRTEQGWQALWGPVVCPPDAVPLPDTQGFVGVGSGFAAYPALCERLASHLDDMRGDVLPHARAIAQLAASRLAMGAGVPAEGVEPLYVRDKVALKVCER